MGRKHQKYILFIAVVLAYYATILNASTVIYTDRSLWEGAVERYEEEFFIDATLNLNVDVISDNGYIDVGAGLWWDELVPSVATTTWFFSNPVLGSDTILGFGGEWNLADPGGEGTAIRLYLDGIPVSEEIPNALVDEFWGIVSTIPFNEVLLTAGTTPGTAETYHMDNMVYARDHDSFTKTDDVNDLDCRSPGQSIVYTICWDNSDIYSIEEPYIVDYLPSGVDISSAVPLGVYDSNIPSYRWDMDTIEPGDSNCVTLNVVVNENAEPGMILHNEAELWGTVDDVNGLPVTVFIAIDTEDTAICCWDQIDPDIIYVDWAAEGNNNGTDWVNAYTDIADALNRATLADPNCSDSYRIYVAQGTYDPNHTPVDSFVLPDNCKVYGGFPSGGSSFKKRNPKKYETILSGDLDDDGFPDVDSVVTMGDETVLDGFSVTDVLESAIYGDGVDFTINSCIVKNSEQYGIYAKDGHVAIKWCKVHLNNADGIYHEGAGYTLTVENCWTMRNRESGIATDISVPTIKHSIISESHFNNAGTLARAGIRIIDPTDTPILHNNTIANNKAEGIHFEDDGVLDNDANNFPEIQNCIIYYNNDGGRQLSGRLNSDIRADYSCIQDCNEIEDNKNFNKEPGFAYLVYDIELNGVPDPENYHIAADSNCIDAGNPDLAIQYIRDPDMDGENRVINSAIDIGADEVYACSDDSQDIYNPQDWTADGVVNLDDFSIFQRAWLSRDPYEFGDPNLSDPNLTQNWNPQCNLDPNNSSQFTIDLADLAEFCRINSQNWLWTACWYEASPCNFNKLDWDDDGLVNMIEFTKFASVWGDELPVDPGNDEEVWLFFNIDNTGTSEDVIDLSDLGYFLDEWLWISCELVDEFPDPEPLVTVLPDEEPTNLERAINLHETSCILEDMWQNDPNVYLEIDPNDWQVMEDSVCDELDALLGTLTENELMAYDLITDDCGCTEQQMAASGSGESMMMSEPMETMAAIEPEPVLDEAENPYTDMPLGELSSLATGIYSVLEAIDVTLVESHENTDNILDAKDFLENVLLDIEASRKN